MTSDWAITFDEYIVENWKGGRRIWKAVGKWIQRGPSCIKFIPSWPYRINHLICFILVRRYIINNVLKRGNSGEKIMALHGWICILLPFTQVWQYSRTFSPITDPKATMWWYKRNQSLEHNAISSRKIAGGLFHSSCIDEAGYIRANGIVTRQWVGITNGAVSIIWKENNKGGSGKDWNVQGDLYC